MKNAVIAALAVALAVSIAVGVIAEASRTVNVEVRVWQDVNDAGALWLSARPDGGSWADAGTVPVRLDDGLSSTGRYRYGDVTLALSVPPPPTCAEPSLAPDCTVLLAARDALAGDGALNWSAAVPVTEWDGVTVSGTPWRVRGLDLRDRGLTGTIPPELGSLPPTLAVVYLAGNAFTGCVPERLRLATTNDLDVLMTSRNFSWCPVAALPSGTLSAGTYQIDGPDGEIVDIPDGGPQIALTGQILGESGISNCFTTVTGENELCLAEEIGLEVGRWIDSDAADDVRMTVNTLFDQISATARPAPPRSCAEPSLEADCAVLLAVRDALAGDGALNWSAAVPVTEWDGVIVSGTPRRVTGLDLRNRGLTGTIPPELGSLPPTLAWLYLGNYLAGYPAGNALTGCIPERLRLAAANDLEQLVTERGLDWCPVATLPSGTILSAGTYQIDGPGGVIVDIPDGGPQIALTRRSLSESGISNCFTTVVGENRICLAEEIGLEVGRRIDSDAADNVMRAVNTLFDAIAATARRAPR